MAFNSCKVLLRQPCVVAVCVFFAPPKTSTRRPKQLVYCVASLANGQATIGADAKHPRVQGERPALPKVTTRGGRAASQLRHRFAYFN